MGKRTITKFYDVLDFPQIMTGEKCRCLQAIQNHRNLLPMLFFEDIIDQSGFSGAKVAFAHDLLSE